MLEVILCRPCGKGEGRYTFITGGYCPIHLSCLSSILIRTHKLSLISNVDLDSITSSEYPEDVSFVTKYQKLIGELFYLSVNTMPEIRFFEMSCLTRHMT